jgi:hypothetical protein
LVAAAELAGCDDTGGDSDQPSRAGTEGGGGSGIAATGGSDRAGTGGSGAVMAPSGGAMARAGSGGNAGSGGAAGEPTSMPADTCEWSACGGDVVGSWAISELCNHHVGEGIVEADCGIVRRTRDTAVDVEGTFTFDADGTFEHSWIRTFDREASVQESCFEMAGISSCAEVASYGFEDCEDASCDGCTCRATCSPTETATLAWSQSGNTVSFDCAALADPRGCPAQVDVCVMGDTMMILWRSNRLVANRQ